MNTVTDLGALDGSQAPSATQTLPAKLDLAAYEGVLQGLTTAAPDIVIGNQVEILIFFKHMRKTLFCSNIWLRDTGTFVQALNFRRERRLKGAPSNAAPKTLNK